MGMTEGKGKGIGLVLRRLVVKGEQDANHVLDLLLFRPAGADDRELYGLGAVLVDLHITLEPGANHGAPSLAELQGRGGIAGEDELLHSHLMGPVLPHHRGDAVEYRP